MAIPRVLCFETDDWLGPYLQERLEDLGVACFPESLAAESLPHTAGVEVVCGELHSRVDAAVLDRLPDLKLVAARTTGYDQIDLEACRSRGLAVCYVPGEAQATAVAEGTFALILALCHHLHRAWDRTRHGDYAFHDLLGMDLEEKTLGVVGLGTIGRRVARLGRGFGMEVLVSRRQPDEALARKMGFRHVSLEELLRASHVVTLHCPLTPETRHLINHWALRTMRQGALLINTARGAVVDTGALVEALESGHLGGAGLDVYEGEDLPHDPTGLPPEERKLVELHHRLLALDNVVLTPHMSFYTSEARHNIADTTVGNIRAFYAGERQNRLV
ncbi:MAG: hydroxyacid dehydrogenase [Chloroflexi bacterium]|nr:hydroxyacid dehydrogenase [Chloroflexota bacterium]